MPRPRTLSSTNSTLLEGDSAAALAAEAAAFFTREVRTAPTLVKYAQPNEYLFQTSTELAQAASDLLGDVPIADAPLVDLVERTESLEVELAATLLYSASHHSYRQIRDLIADFPEPASPRSSRSACATAASTMKLLRAFHAGAALRFDILMDIGGFRDMHRHRRCTQIIQGFTSVHGYESPGSGDLAARRRYPHRSRRPGRLSTQPLKPRTMPRATIAASTAPEAAQSALYLFPLATRIRSLFKMDFAEAQYISELRSGPAGHFSYRRVAWEMYLALQRQHPSLARHIRVTDFTKPIDILQR